MIFPDPERKRDIRALYCLSAGARAQSLWHNLTLRYKGANRAGLFSSHWMHLLHNFDGGAIGPSAVTKGLGFS